MRLWIISQYADPPERGPGGRHNSLARELAKRGHDVIVVAGSWTHFSTGDVDSNKKPAIEAVDGFHFLRLPVPRYRDAHDKRRILNWVLFAWRLRRLPTLLDAKPDVILCSSPSLLSFLGAEWLTKQTNARLIFEVRDIWPLTLIELGGYSARNPLVWLLQRVEDRAYRVADRVISNLPAAVDHMATRGMARHKFTWVPNGFSLLEMEQLETLPSEFERRLPRSDFIVGYTGTLGMANALDTLIEAADLLKDQQDISFVIVGNGREQGALETMVSEHRLMNVHFMGAIPKRQVQSVLKHFDVCYIGLRKTSLYRFGVSLNKLFDYLISGKPIIYSGDSGDYRPIEQFNAGLQVPAADPAAIAEAILKLRDMPRVDRQRMGENGRRAALERHEYGMLAARLEKVLLAASEAESARLPELL